MIWPTLRFIKSFFGYKGTENRWPYLLALSAVPAVVSAIILPWCPESPRYLLLMKNDVNKATKGIILNVYSEPKICCDIFMYNMQQHRMSCKRHGIHNY